jgi:membrane-bound lytic murein transglycosylase D
MKQPADKRTKDHKSVATAGGLWLSDAMQRRCQVRAWCILTLAGALAVCPLSAQDEADVAGMLNAGVTWAQENLSPDLLQQLPLPSDTDWQAFWNGLRGALDGDSLERAAEWMPYVETGVRLLSRVEGGADYAAWLTQRLDYFEMAAALVKQYPAVVPGPAPIPAAPRRAPPPVRGTVRIVPSAPEPPPAPPAPAIRLKRDAAARSTTLWRRALSRRPAPATAAGLVPRLKQVFKDEGIPPQLVWIAEVESSMNPQARNPGGAVGLFQFMPATARRFGLRLRPFDERKNPEKSARAAARYLRFLHGTFGSWPLALAGYNAGEGRVQGVLAKSGGRSFDDIASSLPVETRMYVPKVHAVIQLRENVDAGRLPPPTAVARVAPWPAPVLCLAFIR